MLELGSRTARTTALRQAVKDLDVARVAHNFYIESLIQCHWAICFHIDKTISSSKLDGHLFVSLETTFVELVVEPFCKENCTIFLYENWLLIAHYIKGQIFIILYPNICFCFRSYKAVRLQGVPAIRCLCYTCYQVQGLLISPKVISVSH